MCKQGQGQDQRDLEGVSMCACVGGLGVPVSVGACRCIE